MYPMEIRRPGPAYASTRQNRCRAREHTPPSTGGCEKGRLTRPSRPSSRLACSGAQRYHSARDAGGGGDEAARRRSDGRPREGEGDSEDNSETSAASSASKLAMFYCLN